MFWGVEPETILNFFFVLVIWSLAGMVNRANRYLHEAHVRCLEAQGQRNRLADLIRREGYVVDVGRDYVLVRRPEGLGE